MGSGSYYTGTTCEDQTGGDENKRVCTSMAIGPSAREKELIASLAKGTN